MEELHAVYVIRDKLLIHNLSGTKTTLLIEKKFLETRQIKSLRRVAAPVVSYHTLLNAALRIADGRSTRQGTKWNGRRGGEEGHKVRRK